MKKILFIFVALFIGTFQAMADVMPVVYTGILAYVEGEPVAYPLSETPTVTYSGNTAVLTVNGQVVANVALDEGKILTVEYGTYVLGVTLNAKGYATYSSATDAVLNTADVKAYKASTEAGSELITLEELEGYIPAGTGVLLYGEAGTAVSFRNAIEETVADMSGNTLQPTTLADGSLVDKNAVSGTIWTLSSDNLFLRFVGTAFNPNRAYLVHEQAQNARSMRIVFGGEATGVDAITNAEPVNGKVIENNRVVIMKNGNKYNVNGQKIY